MPQGSLPQWAKVQSIEPFQGSEGYWPYWTGWGPCGPRPIRRRRTLRSKATCCQVQPDEQAMRLLSSSLHPSPGPTVAEGSRPLAGCWTGLTGTEETKAIVLGGCRQGKKLGNWSIALPDAKKTEIGVMSAAEKRARAGSYKVGVSESTTAELLCRSPPDTVGENNA